MTLENVEDIGTKKEKKIFKYQRSELRKSERSQHKFPFFSVSIEMLYYS